MDNMFENFDMDGFDEAIVESIIEEKVESAKIPEVEIVQENPSTDAFNAPVTKTAQSTSLATPSFDFDFGALGIAGIIQGDIGLEVSRYPVDRIKFTTNAKALINIVTPRVVAVKTHYLEGLGNIICTGKSCCDLDGAPRIKYVFPVVVYETDKKGRPISKNLEFKALSVSSETYESIMTKHDLQGDITSVDLLVTCTDESYQKVQLDVAGNCRWKSNQAMIKQVSEFWAENMKDLLKAIARQVTDQEIINATGIADNGPQDSDVDFRDVFKD